MVVNILEIDIDKLNLAIYNPRKDLKPNDEEYIKIKMSITEFGLVEPFIVNETEKGHVLISGHQRIKVLKELGYRKAPCIIVKLTEIKEKALNLALNKITNEWDNEKLSELLKEFNNDNKDYLYTGFSERELKILMDKYITDSKILEENEQDENIDQAIICPHCKKNINEVGEGEDEG